MNPRDFPLPKAGQVWPNFLAESFIRPFVQRVNALSNVSIVRGNADTAVLSDGNLVLTIKDDEVGAGGPGGSSVAVYKITSISTIASDYIAAKEVTFDNSNAETLGAEVNVALPWALRAGRAGTVFPAYAVNDYIVVASSDTGVGVVVSGSQLTLIDLGLGRVMGGVYRGEWSSGVEYAVGDLAYTTKTSGLVTLLWGAVATGTNQAPAFPSTAYWKCIGIVGNFRRFTVNSGQTQDDYLVCDEQGGSVTSVSIYKPYKLRASITAETIAGDSVTYGTYGTDKMSRTATISGVSAKQVIIPYFLTGDSIFAEYDPVADKWQDLNVDGRAWSRKYNQA